MATQSSLFQRILIGCAVVVATGMLTVAGAARADQWQPLRDDPVITDGLTVIAVGRRIHQRCPDVSARMLRSIAFAEDLVDHAETLGFSRSEVTEYLDNREEQRRYRDRARAYFAERGADWDDPDGLCRVGRDEIAEGSQIGRLLR